MMKYTTLLIAAFSLSVIPSLKAQGFYIGPQLGIHKTQDAERDVLVGAAARLKLTPGLGIEGSLNYRKENFENGTTVRSWPIMVTGMFYVLPIVYAAGGAGWYNTTVDFDDELGLDNETSQQFGWHFGAGADIPIGNSRLTGDVRYVFLDYEFDDVPFEGIDSDFYVVTAGFLFGL
jgi:opacity protein-like surface antigen